MGALCAHFFCLFMNCGFYELFPGGPVVQNQNAFPVGTDAVLLADFAAVKGTKRILDIGCGGGVIAMTLAFNDANISAVGVEIDSAAACEARENAAQSGLCERVSVICGDVREFGEKDLGGRFDLVVSNPPYFSTSSGKVSENLGRARSEASLTLAELVSSAARLVKNGGKFCFVYRPERLGEAFSLLREAKLEPKRLRFVHAEVTSPPSAALIECRLGGGIGLDVMPPLILRENGEDSAEMRKIYRLS